MSIKSSIGTPQSRMRALSFTLTTTGTPAVSGSDKNQIASVVDNGAGDVTVIFRKPFVLVPQVQVTSQGSTLQHSQVKAKDVDRVTINIYDNANAAADGVVDVFVIGKDDKFYR